MNNLTNAMGESARPGDDIGGGGAKYDAGKSEVFQGVFDYFPRALLEVANVSSYGALKYSWGGAKNVSDAYNRYSNAQARHTLLPSIEGPYDIAGKSMLLHDAQAAWNALMKLETGLKEGRYESTRGDIAGLLKAKEPKPATPDLVLGKGVTLNRARPYYEAELADAKASNEKNLDVRVVPDKASDAEVADIMSGILSQIFGGAKVVTDPEEWFKLTGEYPPGEGPAAKPRKAAAAPRKSASSPRPRRPVPKAARAPARKR